MSYIELELTFEVAFLGFFASAPSLLVADFLFWWVTAGGLVGSLLVRSEYLVVDSGASKVFVSFVLLSPTIEEVVFSVSAIVMFVNMLCTLISLSTH